MPQDRVERCASKGMWGGGCPQDWEIADAEAYAIFRYLEKVVQNSDTRWYRTRSTSRSTRRQRQHSEKTSRRAKTDCEHD